jgi:hypothetical protein
MRQFLAANLQLQGQNKTGLDRQPVNQIGAAAMSILLCRHHVLQRCANDPAKLGSICSTAARLVLRTDATHPGVLAAAMLAVGFEAEAASNQLLAFIYLYTAVLASDQSPSTSRLVGEPRSPVIDATLPIAARASALSLRALTDMLSMRDEAALARSKVMADEIRMVLRLVVTLQQRSYLHVQTCRVFWTRVMPDWIRLLERSLEVTGSSTVSVALSPLECRSAALAWLPPFVVSDEYSHSEDDCTAISWTPCYWPLDPTLTLLISIPRPFCGYSAV